MWNWISCCLLDNDLEGDDMEKLSKCEYYGRKSAVILRVVYFLSTFTQHNIANIKLIVKALLNNMGLSEGEFGMLKMSVIKN